MDLYEMSPAEQNQTRAYWAQVGLEAFGEETGQTDYFDGVSIGSGELMEIGGDFLANLFHLAVQNGVEPRELTRQALMHFAEEMAEAEEDETKEIAA